MPYDVLADFDYVTLIMETPFVLTVNAQTPVRSMKELVNYAKANPGKLNIGSFGVGSTPHILAEILSQEAGISLMHVPFKGSALITTAVIGGEVDVVFSDMAVVLPHVQAGKLRALAVTSAKRALALPELPTLVEAGIAGYVTNEHSFTDLVDTLCSAKRGEFPWASSIIAGVVARLHRRAVGGRRLHRRERRAPRAVPAPGRGLSRGRPVPRGPPLLRDDPARLLRGEPACGHSQPRGGADPLGLANAGCWGALRSPPGPPVRRQADLLLVGRSMTAVDPPSSVAGVSGTSSRSRSASRL